MKKTFAVSGAALAVLAVGVLVAVVLFLVSGTPSAATDFCALSMEEEAFKALKSGDKPNLTVSEGKDGKEIVWK